LTTVPSTETPTVPVGVVVFPPAAGATEIVNLSLAPLATVADAAVTVTLEFDLGALMVYAKEAVEGAKM